MDQLGINVPIIIAQVVNFTILLVVLKIFLYKPTLKILDERREKAAKLVSDEKSLQEKLTSLEELKADIRKKAQADAKELLAEAKEQAKAEKNRLLTEAKAEISRDRERLEKDLATQLEAKSRQLTSQTVDLATEMVKKVMAETLDDTHHRQLIKSALTKLSHHA